MTDRPNPLKVLAVCGMGMGTSLILKMTCETAIGRIGVPAKVDYSDLSTAKGQNPDILVGQGMHMSELDGVAPIVVVIDNFVDDAALEAKLRAALTDKGWL